MFQRKSYEINYETFRLDSDYKSQSSEHENTKITFSELMRIYQENFIIISQKDKAAYLQLTLSDIIGFFSIPVCTKQDGRTKCKYNCDCAKSLDIGMQIYEKGGVQNFHQFGNFVIGCVIEQQTDPLTRVAIEFEKSSMKHIRRIYCPCKFMYCPHAFAVLYFRLKIQSFYAIKLPQELFDGRMTQAELTKFYGYIIEQSRALPLMCDYQAKWSLENFKQYADVSSSMMYAYCHKSLLPIPFNIIEEQSRARKWISDLHTKRSLSVAQHNSNPSILINSNPEFSFAGHKMKQHHQQDRPISLVPHNNKHNMYKNHNHHHQHHLNQPAPHTAFIYKPQPLTNKNHRNNHTNIKHAHHP